jgi:exonuclease III
MRFGTWNVRSLYRTGSVTAAARELARYKLDLVGVQEVRWDREGTVRAGDYNFYFRKGNENHQLGKGCFVHHRTVSAVIRVEFVSDRVSYDMIYLLSAIGLSPGTVHIYTQTVHRTIQNKQYMEQHNNFGRVRAVPRLG